MVEATVPLSILGDRIIGEKPTAMIRGFVVSRDGVYHGVGTGLDVLRLSMEMIRVQSEDLLIARTQREPGKPDEVAIPRGDEP